MASSHGVFAVPWRGMFFFSLVIYQGSLNYPFWGKSNSCKLFLVIFLKGISLKKSVHEYPMTPIYWGLPTALKNRWVKDFFVISMKELLWNLIISPVPTTNEWVFPKIGVSPKMDDENNGKRTRGECWGEAKKHKVAFFGKFFGEFHEGKTGQKYGNPGNPYQCVFLTKSAVSKENDV